MLDFDYNCIKTDPLVAQFYEVGGWRLCVGLLGFAVVCVSVHNESAHAPLIGAPCCACAAAGKCRPCHGLQLLQALPWVTSAGPAMGHNQGRMCSSNPCMSAHVHGRV